MKKGEIMIEGEDLNGNIYAIKFGGTSVGNADAIDKMVNIVAGYRQDGLQAVVVLSAMNGTTNRLVNITEGIKENNRALVNSELSAVRDHHLSTIDEFLIPKTFKNRARSELLRLFAELEGISEITGVNNRELTDKILSYGERLMVRAAKWRFLGIGIHAEAVDATSIIKTDDNFGEAIPNFQVSEMLSRMAISRLFKKGMMPIVTGFIGETLDGKTTTLGRGGSDYTVSLLGRFLNARKVFIYTDVDGVFTNDPRTNSDTRLIDEMTYEEADAKAKAGEKVLYPKTVEPLVGTGIELYVKNTFNPFSAGTRISDGKIRR